MAAAVERDPAAWLAEADDPSGVPAVLASSDQVTLNAGPVVWDDADVPPVISQIRQDRPRIVLSAVWKVTKTTALPIELGRREFRNDSRTR